MQGHNTRGRSEGCGGGGLPVVGLGLAVLMGLSCVACSSSSPTGTTDGAGHPEVWEVKANDIKVDGGLSDLLDLTGDIARFDVRVDPEVCAGKNAGTGCPCVDNDDCASGLCFLHMGEKVCTAFCESECPDGWSCQQKSGTDPVFVCVSLFPSLCLPCTASDECKILGGGKCVVYGPEVGAFCGAGCDEGTPCPVGYECKETQTTEDQTSSQCRLVEGECACTVYAVAEESQTACEAANEFGACPGWRACSEEGLGECSAAAPAKETCNGMDNDCDGSTDEGDLCEDGDDCTKNECVGEAGCTHEPMTGNSCFDEDACTYDDHCEAGICVGLPVDCEDGNSCTDDDCDPLDGCFHEDNSLACENDGDPCTEDLCSGGECTHPPGNDGATCEEDGDPCTTDLCDAGECTHPPGNDEEPCVDDDPCTMDEHCEAGFCLAGGVKPICLSPCGDGVCSPSPADVDCPVDCGSCGDGVCGLNEAGLGGGTCPADCLPPCGNGLCEGGENPDWCLVDCSGCGDGFCGLGESPELCPGDCPVPCGDGECGFGEGPLLCPVDCTPPCGDGVCQTGENSYNCLPDCATCGDGICGGSETEDNCAQDCDTPCGNGACDGDETSDGCPVDCGPCGDGTCGFSESEQSCPGDCWQGCGDGECQAYLDETGESCPVDCISDKDGDGVEDQMDNCAALYNPEQEDFDVDGVGDLCDLDDDDDGDLDATDCKPLDAEVSHLATETCNGVDDDCSGEVDEDVVCDDGDPCTEGSCEGGVCEYEFLPLEQLLGLECICSTDDDCDPVEDGDVCNGTLYCDKENQGDEKGLCQVDPDTVIESCPEDGVECTFDTCDPELGCVAIAVDGNCEDSNICTNDTCDLADGCQYEALTGPACDDGNLCTQTDVCVAGECVGNQKDCDDGVNCTQDACNELGGCVHQAQDTACDDANICNGLESCDPDLDCQDGIPLVCDDGNACNGLETCDQTQGCQDGPFLTCDNNDVCDGVETCDPDVGCVEGIALDCDDGNPCTVDSCNSQIGICDYAPLDGPCTGDGCDPAALCQGAVGACSCMSISCAAGDPICTPGAGTPYEERETLDDGIDNDCDGFVDEGRFRLHQQFNVRLDHGGVLSYPFHGSSLTDVDGDGDLDWVLGYGNSPHQPAGVRLYLNNGTGRFVAGSQAIGTAFVNGLVLADFDGDDDPDLLYGVHPVSISGPQLWRNNGEGMFGNSVEWDEDWLEPAAEDLDGDGDVDFVAQRTSDCPLLFFNDGTGHFPAGVSFQCQAGGVGRILLADIDGDLTIDIIHSPESQPIELWVNEGEGSFGFLTTLDGDTISGAKNLVATDLTGDSALDIAVNSGSVNGYKQLSIYINQGKGTFSEPVIFEHGHYGGLLTPADIDGDGDTDLVAGIYDGSGVSLWWNDASGNLVEEVAFEQVSGHSGVLTADLDQDGWADILSWATHDIGDGNANIWLNKGGCVPDCEGKLPGHPDGCGHACPAGPSVACDDGNPCTVDMCSPQEGCVHELAQDGPNCVSQSSCTQPGSDVCINGICVSGDDMDDCDDDDECTADVCAAGECVYQPIPACGCDEGTFDLNMDPSDGCEVVCEVMEKDVDVVDVSGWSSGYKLFDKEGVLYVLYSDDSKFGLASFNAGVVSQILENASQGTVQDADLVDQTVYYTTSSKHLAAIDLAGNPVCGPTPLGAEQLNGIGIAWNGNELGLLADSNTCDGTPECFLFSTAKADCSLSGSLKEIGPQDGKGFTPSLWWQGRWGESEAFVTIWDDPGGAKGLRFDSTGAPFGGAKQLAAMQSRAVYWKGMFGLTSREQTPGQFSRYDSSLNAVDGPVPILDSPTSWLWVAGVPGGWAVSHWDNNNCWADVRLLATDGSPAGPWMKTGALASSAEPNRGVEIYYAATMGDLFVYPELLHDTPVRMTRIHCFEPYEGECVLQCDGKECGADGCGDECMPGCEDDTEYCDGGECQSKCGNESLEEGEDCHTCPEDSNGCPECDPPCDPSLNVCVKPVEGPNVCAAKMVAIPAGSFWMGCNNCAGSTVNDTSCHPDEHPYHEVYLDAYEMDKTLVTAGQYGACVSAGECDSIEDGDCSWGTTNYGKPGKGKHPVNCISWEQASAYCEWAGKELCREAQWEKGARGGCEQNGGPSNCKAQSRKYPWGNDTATCELAVKGGCDGDTQEVCSLSPAGDSPYGLCDMAGNVWEWQGDKYQKDYYCDGPAASGDASCAEFGSWPGSPTAWSNPEGPESGSDRVLRGVSFEHHLNPLYAYLRVSLRYYENPSVRNGTIGGRCCKSPEE